VALFIGRVRVRGIGWSPDKKLAAFPHYYSPTLMLRFSLFGFPVEVQWPFWLTVVLLSGRMDANNVGQLHSLAMWVVVVFIAILGHELGHALAMRHFGDRSPRITLYAMGGLAHPSSWFSRWQNIFVSAAGPIASLLMGALGFGLFFILRPERGSLGQEVLGEWLWVNIGWSFFNLLPIMPLDGGQIAEAFFAKGSQRKIPIYLSIGFASAVALYMLLGWHSVFNTLFFGMLAFNSWKRLKGLPENDFRDWGR
jgi:stage IV sporulation protein FB